MNKPFHHRLRRFESFDEIKLKVIPRYKTSGLSGDEWRTGVAVTYVFKGEVIHERFYTSMEAAIMTLGSDWLRAQVPVPMRVIEMEGQGYCDQPSCSRTDTKKFRIKRRTSANGEFLDQIELSDLEYYRQFCPEHARRGDCSREDCDDNYEAL